MSTFINTRTYFQSQTKIIQTEYSKSAPMKPLRYPTIFNAFAGDEDRSFFQALSLVGFGTLSLRDEGQSAAIDASKEGLLSAFPYVTYALKYIVTKEMSREDAKRVIPKLPALLRYSSDQTKEFLFWNVFNLAFSGQVLLADGQPLCSNAHPLTGAAGTYSNTLGAVSLTVETLQQAFVLMGNMPDDRGLTTYRTPQDLIYPLGLHKTAVEVLSSMYYPTSNENKVNAVKGSVEPHAIEYLTSNANGPFPWFVLAGKGALGTDSHTVFASVKWDEQRAWVNEENESLNHETEFRAVWGAVDGRGIVGSQGA